MTSEPGYPGAETCPAAAAAAAVCTPDPDPAGRGEARSAEGGAAPLLDTYAKSVGRTTTETTPNTTVHQGEQADDGESAKSAELRTSRWSALGVLWDMSTLERVRKCGRVTVGPSGTVQVRKTGAAVGYGGLATCGSVWACPRCSAKIQAVRRLELGVLVAAAAAQGLTVAFGTVTLRHKQGQALGMLWDAVTKGYRSVGQSRKVRDMRAELGRVGYVRTFEVTYGQNGWHPHIHTLQLFKFGVAQDQLDALADAEFRVWQRQAKNRGLGAPLRRNYELRRVSDASVALSDYFAKGVYDPTVARSSKSIGFEMSGSMTKAGRGKGSRTPWQILDDFKTTGDLAEWDVWEEYERASKGKRALVWSPGLKDRFGVDDVDDEAIAEEEVGGVEDVLFHVTDWSAVARDAKLGGQLLGEVRRGGLSAGLAFCRSHGIPTAVGVPAAAAA